MKLFYSPGACSLAVHIILRETGLPFTLERVDLSTHKTAAGNDYYRNTPNGYVPLLELVEGGHLTEVPVISQYLCDKVGRVDLMPAAGSMARYHVMEWQNFITSELHKGFGALFNPVLDAAAKAVFSASLQKRLQWVSTQLHGKQYLTGAAFTAADAYLFTVANWTRYVDLDIGDYPDLQSYQARIAARPTVQTALKAEGLLS